MPKHNNLNPYKWSNILFIMMFIGYYFANTSSYLNLYSFCFVVYASQLLNFYVYRTQKKYGSEIILSLHQILFIIKDDIEDGISFEDSTGYVLPKPIQEGNIYSAYQKNPLYFSDILNMNYNNSERTFVGYSPWPGEKSFIFSCFELREDCKSFILKTNWTNDFGTKNEYYHSHIFKDFIYTFIISQIVIIYAIYLAYL